MILRHQGNLINKIDFNMKNLILMIGSQGSGKTTYCKRKLKDYTRISQDDMGKQKHIEIFHEAIKRGNDVVIDRINHRREQRLRYVDYARNYDYKIKFIWLDCDKITCLKRLEEREEHPTIALDADHLKILNHYFDKFETPSSAEYDELERIEKRVYADVYDIRRFIKDKFIIVGDIHGCYDEFMELLDKCNYQYGDTVISIGDLMDRGSESRKVLTWFYNNDGFAVEGNHDNKFRRWLNGRKVKLKHGLEGTIKEFEGISEQHRDTLLRWMNKWPQIIRVPDVDGKPMFVVHAGLDGRWPITRQKVETCLYVRYLNGKDFFDEEQGIPWYSTLSGEYKVVSGHMIQSNPFISKNAILLDGGAYQGGVLRGLVDGKKLVEVQSKNYEKMDK